MYIHSSRNEGVFSEDNLKKMEKCAAEMKVMKVTFNVQNSTGVCDAIFIGLGIRF